MTRSIVVISQKGGVGKSTLADELAFSLDRTGTAYAFYDLDGQGGSLHSGHRDPDPAVAVVDTPAGLDDRTLKVLPQADLAVVAVNASGRDMSPLKKTFGVLDEAGVPYVVVVTRCNRYNVANDFVDWLIRKVGTDRVLTVPQAEAVPQAYLAKKSVVDYQRGGKCADAVIAFANAVRARVGLAPEAVKELRRRDEANSMTQAPAKTLADNTGR